MLRIELEQLNDMILEYECQLDMLNQQHYQAKNICDRLIESWEGASKEQFALNAEQALLRLRLFIAKMERMRDILKSIALPEANRQLNRCEAFADVLTDYHVAEPSEYHSPSGTLYLDDSFITGIEESCACIGYEETQRERMLWDRAMECIDGLKFTSMNLNWQDQEFRRYTREQSDFILQFRESFYHYHQDIDGMEERLSAEFEMIAEIQTADISGRSYEPLIEQDWSRELVKLGVVIGNMITNGQDIQLLTAGSGEKAVSASMKLSEKGWSKDLKGIGSLLMGVLVEQSRYANVSGVAWGTFGNNLLMDLLLSTQWGKNKEEELINQYLDKEQYYLGKLTVDVVEEQQSGAILEMADGLIEAVKRNSWISALLAGGGAGGAGMGLAQTTAGTVELAVNGAAAVSAIEIVVAGAVIGTLVIAAAAHNNPKSQGLQDENSQKLEETKENSNNEKDLSKYANTTLPETGSNVHPNVPEWHPGDPARGILKIENQEIPIASGARGPGEYLKMLPKGKGSGLNAQIPTHVEGHVAGIMRETGIKEAELFINKPPCATGAMCRYNLNKILPPDSILTVHFPNEAGEVITWQFKSGLQNWTILGG